MGRAPRCVAAWSSCKTLSSVLGGRRRSTTVFLPGPLDGTLVELTIGDYASQSPGQAGRGTRPVAAGGVAPSAEVRRTSAAPTAGIRASCHPEARYCAPEWRGSAPGTTLRAAGIRRLGHAMGDRFVVGHFQLYEQGRPPAPALPGCRGIVVSAGSVHCASIDNVETDTATSSIWRFAARSASIANRNFIRIAYGGKRSPGDNIRCAACRPTSSSHMLDT